MAISARLKPHHGRNLKRLRDMLGMKQEALAFELGSEWSQKRISLLEQKETISREILERIADILQVPAKAILDFDEATAIRNLRNQYENIASFSQKQEEQEPEPVSEIHAAVRDNALVQLSFNPLEKWITAMEDNEKLYERLLKSEQEKVMLLQKLLDLK